MTAANLKLSNQATLLTRQEGDLAAQSKQLRRIAELAHVDPSKSAKDIADQVARLLTPPVIQVGAEKSFYIPNEPCVVIVEPPKNANETTNLFLPSDPTSGLKIDVRVVQRTVLDSPIRHITIHGNGREINGYPVAYMLTPGGALSFVFDGTQWSSGGNP